MNSTPELKAFRPATRVGSFLVSPEDLASLAEIAEVLGVTKRTAQNYTKRPDFPEPLGRVAAGPIWRRADVEEWARRTLPLRTGRPRKENT